MEYKMTQRLNKKQDNHFVRVETGILAGQNCHLQENQSMEVSVVMGTVESLSPQPSVFPPHQNTPELIWQQQTTTGNRRVFHYLKDDGCGRLSFFRASSAPQENVEPAPPASPPTVLAPVTENEEVQISPRAAISAGVAVNFLALTIGGYLMYASPQSPISETAQLSGPQLHAQADNKLQPSYEQAQTLNHQSATNTVTKADPTAQQKLSREVQAHKLLQTAYNKASAKDFDAAIGSLKQIPKDTIAYTKVPAKVAEYSQKQRQLIAAGNTFPQVALHASASATLNPGDIPQEISTQPLVFSLPKTQLGG
ncbi:hypothetical protein NG798_22240 [Ancylothrix sp. C2]|uniref:hypothetical protein n=1 Tax=Ancylothrix sp. D3o TaxID=2953691 RepID=UPI0021BA3F4C|nr:hypothetical protein [Ancylothrix sp. D3o]MCT7952519.1 hypothetical protein [Ancylothrix sp. D3o]